MISQNTTMTGSVIMSKLSQKKTMRLSDSSVSLAFALMKNAKNATFRELKRKAWVWEYLTSSQASKRMQN